MLKKAFEVDLTGIIKILSDHLYTEKEVFIRELLQNAIDAINARRAVEHIIPEIRIEYFENENGDGFVISDNGIGLSRNEIETFLAKVGSSSKSGKDLEIARSDFIGQFGIGILSCFMVTDNITILTKSQKKGKSLKWVGNILGTYHIEELAEELGVGTKVVLQFRKKTHLNWNKVSECISRYGAYLDIPVQQELNGKPMGSVNKKFPFEEDLSYEECLSAGERIFGEKYNSFIFLKDEQTGNFIGIIYFLTRPNYAFQHKKGLLFVKRMFVTDKLEDILPKWATFVQVIVNANALSLNASREKVYSDANTEALTKVIQRAIINYFNELSRNKPDILESIIQLHELALKQMALSDSSFLKSIYKWFSFYTSMGRMNLETIKSLKKTLLYISDLDEYRQISPIAGANKVLVLNAAYVYEEELLDEIATIDKSSDYVKIDAKYFGNYLGEIDIEDYKMYTTRIAHLQQYLNKYDCILELKQFEPAGIQSVYHSSMEAQVSRDIGNIRKQSDDLWASISENVYEEYDGKSELFLNFKNEIVVSLLKKPNPLDKEIIETILINAMLLGHYPLNSAVLETMNKNYGALITLAFNN